MALNLRDRFDQEMGASQGTPSSPPKSAPLNTGGSLFSRFKSEQDQTKIEAARKETAKDIVVSEPTKAPMSVEPKVTTKEKWFAAINNTPFVQNLRKPEAEPSFGEKLKTGLTNKLLGLRDQFFNKQGEVDKMEVAKQMGGYFLKNQIENLPGFSHNPLLAAKSSSYADAVGESYTQGVEQYGRLAQRAKDFGDIYFGKEKLDNVEKTKRTLDLVSSFALDAGGAIFNTAINVLGVSKVGAFGKENLGKALEKTMGLAGKGAAIGLKYLPGISDEDKARLEPSVRQFAGAVTVGLLFRVAHVSVKGIKNKMTGIEPMKGVIGLNSVEKITPESVATAYKITTDKIITDGIDVQNRMDVVNGVKPILDEVAQVGEKNWSADSSPLMSAVNEASDSVLAQFKEGGDKLAKDIQVEEVKSAIEKPLTPSLVEMRRSMGKDAQFAFENEIVDLNAKNDIVLSKKAEASNLRIERISDPFDDRAGFFDVETGTIKLNEDKIQQLVDTLADDTKALKIGEGRLVTSFQKKTGESLADLKTRLEDTILKHETSHSKTITPEDMARLAQASALKDEVALRKIRSEMEGKADRYSIEKANDLIDDKLQNDINRASEAVAMRQDIVRIKKEQSFASSEVESAYKDWEKQVKRNPEFYSAGEEAFRNKMRESPKNKLMTDKDFASRWDGAMKSGEDIGVSQVSDLFDLFRKRFDGIRKLDSQYKKLKEGQKSLFEGKDKLDKRVSDALGRAIRAERALEKSGDKVRSLELGKLKERIKGRVEKEVLKERIAESTGRTKAKYARRLLRRQVDEKVKALLPKRTAGGRMKGRMEAGTQDFISNVFANRKENRGVKVSSVFNKIMKWRSENPDSFEIPEKLYQELKLAESSGYLRQNAVELRETLLAIKDMSAESIKARQQKRLAIAENAAKITDGIKETLVGDRKFKSDPIELVKKNNAMKTGVQSFWFSTKTLNGLTNILGPQMKSLVRETYNKIAISKNNFGKANDSLVNHLEKEYGIRWQNEIHDKMHQQVELGNFRDVNGKNVPLRASRFQAMAIYTGLNDKKFKQNLTHADGNAWTSEMIKKSESILSDSDKRTSEYIVRNMYGGQYGRFAEAFQEVSGVRLGYTEGYAGSLKYKNDIKGEKAIESESSALDIGFADYKTRRGMSTEGATSRTNYIGEMKISDNPIGDALSYIKQTEHFIQMSKLMGDWDRVMNDTNTIAAMKKRFGKDYVQQIKFHVEDLRRGGIVTEKALSMNRLIEVAQQNVGKALISSPSVWMGQWADFAAFKAEAKSSSAFNKGIFNWKSLQADLAKYVPAVEARTRKTQAEATSRIENRKGKIGRTIEKIGDVGTAPIEWNDRLTTKISAAGLFADRVEFYTKRMKLDTERAKIEAGKDIAIFIQDNLSTPDFLGKSNLEKRSGVGKLLTALRNQPNKIFHRLWIKVGELKRGEITPREFGHFVYWNNIVQPTMYYGLRIATKQALRGAKVAILRTAGQKELADKEEEKIKNEDYKRGAVMSVLNNATSGMVLGDIIQTAIENSFNDKNYELRPSVISAASKDFWDGFNELNQGDYGTAAARTSRGILRSVGVGDPLDLFGTLITKTSSLDTARRAAEKKTAAYKIKAKRKAYLAKLKKIASQ